jgi:hypothetical protein
VEEAGVRGEGRRRGRWRRNEERKEEREEKLEERVKWNKRRLNKWKFGQNGRGDIGNNK